VCDPWYRSVSKPTRSQVPPFPAITDNLSLSRVYGYSCMATRNNAKYSACGAVIYPSGGTVVRVDLGSGTQSYGTVHAGFEICALAISIDRSILATSDVAAEPQIAVWSTSNIEHGPNRVIRGPHLHAITLLAFDDNNRGLLASVGADENHTVAVHDIVSGFLLFSSSTTKCKPLSLCFGNGARELVIVGVKNVLFFAFAAGHAATRHARASFARIGRQGTLQAFLCCAYMPSDDCIVGTADGHLYVLGKSSHELEKSVKAHDGFIYSMDAPWCRTGQITSVILATGARDGDIKLWNNALDMVSKFTNRGAGPVRSVFFSADLSRVLVGSQAAAQVREFRASDGVPTSPPLAGGGAAAGELWALATHPSARHAATASDEGALVIWDLDATDVRNARKVGKLLPGACRALTFSPDGTILVACFVDARGTSGGDDMDYLTTKLKIDGLVQLMRAETGTLVSEFTDARKWMRDIKFSPDGRSLVAGDVGGNVHIFVSDDNGQFTRKATLSLSMGAAICSIDIGVDNRHVQISDEARTISYGDLYVGIAVPDSVVFQDTEWATWTSPFGWPVTGVHEVYARPNAGRYETDTLDARGSLEPALSLSCLSRSNSSRVVATGDHYGVFRLLRYPAIEGAVDATRIGVAHVGTVRRLAWTADDSHVISIGSQDRNVCVWHYEPDSTNFDALNYASIDVQDYDDAIDADGGRAMAAAVERAFKTRGDMGGQEEASDWVAALVPPSNLEQEDPGEPQLTLELDCAHGHRSDDIRGCVGYNAKGGIVYAAGALGIIYDSRTHTQCFQFHHRGSASLAGLSTGKEAVSSLADIISLTVSFDGRFAASGDQGYFAHVRVWDAMTGKTICVLPRHLRCGICALSFSCNSSQLAAIGGDIDHSYALYATRSGEWQDATRVSFGSGMRSRVFCAVFVGIETYPCFLGSEDGVEFAWPSACGGIRRRGGLFDRQRSPRVPILCAVRAQAVLTDVTDTRSEAFAALTGTASGSLYLWNGTKVKDHIPNAHDGPVYAIAAATKRGMYATAGRDGTVKTWNCQLQPIESFKLTEIGTPLLTPTAASLCFAAPFETKLLVVARSGEMCELTTYSGNVAILTEAHARRKKQATESHGLDVNPKYSDLYATSGDDGTVRIWSCGSRRCMAKVLPDVLGGAAVRSCSWAPDGIRLAIGLGGDPTDKARDGTFVLLQVVMGVDCSA